MKVIFMGTPEFSAHFLRAVVDAGHEVCAVVTQPDRKAGRGRKLTPPPVKIAAEELDLPVLQPDNLKDPAFAKELKSFNADISVVVAFSILPKAILEATSKGALNMHGSLLPKYRGAAPIQWAVAKGDTETGATVFLLDEKMDHGPILRQVKMPINADDTSMSIFTKMVPLGCKAVVDALRDLESGKVEPLEQDHAAATPAPKLKKEDGLINFEADAQTVYNNFRGFFSWPGCWAHFRGKVMRIHACAPYPDMNIPAGALQETDQGLFLGLASGALKILELQQEGKAKMMAADFLRGLQEKEEMKLTR